MLATGIVLLFLVPGLAAYSALYGMFDNGRTIAPEPPSANAIETVIVIAGASLAVHTLTAALFGLNGWICRSGCPLSVPPAWLDPYGRILAVLDGAPIRGRGLALTLCLVAAQGAATYAAVRLRLARLARRDRLPAWIYGWTTALANALDNSDMSVVAYVLTDIESDGRAVGYGGPVHSMGLKPDGGVARIALIGCDRYLIDLGSGRETRSLSEPLSRLSFMVIEGAHIRNIAFETLSLAPDQPA